MWAEVEANGSKVCIEFCQTDIPSGRSETVDSVSLEIIQAERFAEALATQIDVAKANLRASAEKNYMQALADLDSAQKRVAELSKLVEKLAPPIKEG